MRPIVKAIIGGAVKGAEVKAPIISNVIGAVVQTAADKSTVAPVPGPVTPANAAAVVEHLTEAALKAPAAVNAMNAEPWWQSRVQIGVYISLACLLARSFGADISPDLETEFVNDALIVGQAAGVLYALYGRVRTGLLPMWSRIQTWLGG